MNENMVRLLVQSGVPNEDIMDILTTGEGKITSYAWAMEESSKKSLKHVSEGLRKSFGINHDQ